MEQIFISLLNTSITAGYLVIAVMLLRPILKKAPKYIRCILWGLVGLRLVLPFSFESVLSLIPSAETIPPEIVTSPTPTIHSGISLLNSTVNPILTQSMAPAPEVSANPMQIAIGIAWNVWLLGVIAMVIYSAVSFLLLKRKLREAVQDGGNVWVCDRVSSPFLLGLFRPNIYLPSDLAEESKVYVLAHENAHIRRKDHWWKPLGFLLLTVYWFNPLMWVAYIFFCRDIEFACDEKVIKEMGTDCKKSYSEALINCSISRKMISACPVAFGEDGVKGRIKSVLNYKKPAFWIILIALILCIVVAVCFLTNPPDDREEPQIPANKYRFRATVVEIYKDSLLVEPLENHEYFSGAEQVVIRLNGRSKDDYRLGCIVEVIYDSQIQQSLPPIIPNASSIFNLDLVSSYLPDPHYSFTAIVTEVWDDCIIVKYQHFPLHNFEFSYYQVNTDPTGYTVGDKVNIAYDGTVTETEPYDILGEVYSIEIVDYNYGSSDTNHQDLLNAISFDIDNDGIIEDCLIKPGPTYGILSVEITVQENGITEYVHPLVLINFNDCGFRETSDGKYVFVLADYYTNTTNTEIEFDISVENGQILFTNSEGSIDDLHALHYLKTLKTTYPQFFGLGTFKGLEVYVWKNGDWRCGVRSGTNRNATLEELQAFGEGTTLQEMALILSSYGITRDEVAILYSYDPAFSGENPNTPTADQQVYIEDTLFAYLPRSVIPEPTIEYEPESLQNSKALKNGFYSLSGSGKDYFATPYIHINTAKKTANIGGSPLISYSESGRYFIIFDRLIVKTQNALYTFRLQGKDTLMLVSDSGFEKSPIPASGTYVLCSEYP